MKKTIQRLEYLKAFVLIAVAVPLLTMSVGHVSTALALDKATFNMSWLPQGSTGGIIVGIYKGFYKEVGIDAKAVRGYGGNRTANELDQGMFEFALGNPVGMIFTNSKGGNVRMVGSLNDQWPASLCYIKEVRDPRSIADLKGLTTGGGNYSPVHKVLPAWLKKNGFSQNHVKLIRMKPAVVNAALIEGQIDLAECWAASNRPLIKKLAKKAGKTAGWLEYNKFNLNIYGSGIATSEKVLSKNPDMVRRFVKATFRGYRYLQQNPKDSADIIVKEYPALDREVVLEQVKDMNEIISRQDPAHPMGWMKEDRWKETISFITSAYKVEKPVKASDMYTNAFLK
ncbi:MAG: ABC transporter substrate-binding protein [Desulfatiglandales bacterium]|nr:ABC transporter substrate-binding protein [Desulfatiglandales bacterium]